MKIELTGTEVLVTIVQTSRGFALTLTDIDSGNVLPTVKIFPELTKAMDFAYSCLN